MYARTVFLLMFLFITYAQTVAVVAGQGAFPREQTALACSAAGYLGARGMGRWYIVTARSWSLEE